MIHNLVKEKNVQMSKCPNWSNSKIVQTQKWLNTVMTSIYKTRHVDTFPTHPSTRLHLDKAHELCYGCPFTWSGMCWHFSIVQIVRNGWTLTFCTEGITRCAKFGLCAREARINKKFWMVGCSQSTLICCAGDFSIVDFSGKTYVRALISDRT